MRVSSDGVQSSLRARRFSSKECPAFWVLFSRKHITRNFRIALCEGTISAQNVSLTNLLGWVIYSCQFQIDEQRSVYL